MKQIIGAAVFGLVFGLVGAAQAGDVTIKGVHLCCGACVKAVQKALNGTEGVSNIAADRDAKTISFTATDEKAAKSAITALADGGFYGKASLDGKELPFPDAGAKKGAKADKVVLKGLHLCCGACVRDANKVLEKVPGVDKVEVDRSENRATLTGKDIDVRKAVDALNAGGFFGRVEKK